MSKLILDRRDFLRLLGAGAAASAALTQPFVNRVFADPTRAPKRMVIFWSPNGTVPPNFFPQASDPSLTSRAILAPLAEHEDDLLIARATYQGTGDHKTGTPFSTTGWVNVTNENLDDPDPKKRPKISIDQEIANALGSTTAKPSLTLCGQSKDGRRGIISANDDGTRNPSIREPADAYEYMFGPYKGAGMPVGPVADPNDVAEVQRGVYDTILTGLDGMNGRVGQIEQAKLRGHREAVQRMRDAIKDPQVDAPEFMCTAENPLEKGARFEYSARLDKHCELIAASFACDLTRVVSFMTAPSGGDNTNFGFLGVGGDIHQVIAHGSTTRGFSDMLNDNDQKMTKVNAFYASKLAYLIKLLKEIPEGDGSVFDNTALFWLNECSIGNHGHQNIPIVIAGSMGGFFKQGDYIEEPIDYLGLLVAMAQGMGHQIDVFGNGPARSPEARLLA